jgi:hypothetical protein
MQAAVTHNPGFLLRFAKGALPIAIACIFISIAGTRPSPPVLAVALFAASGLVLWLGWSAIRANTLTRWLGTILAVYVALLFGLYVLGVTLALALVLFPVFLLALPFLAYDLLFRAPMRDDPARDDLANFDPGIDGNRS